MRWMLLAAVVAVAAPAFAEEAPRARRKAPTITFDEDDGIVRGTPPPASYIIPRSQTAKRAVDTAGETGFEEALRRTK